MGRSFDRGGQSRKERERGKRRAYRQAVRDREAREAAAQAIRTGSENFVRKQKAPRIAAEMPAMQPVAAQQDNVMPAAPQPQIERKSPGFFAQMFGRFFKKAA